MHIISLCENDVCLKVTLNPRSVCQLTSTVWRSCSGIPGLAETSNHEVISSSPGEDVDT